LITPGILRLVYRNIRVNVDPGNMIILIGIPALYLVFFGLGVQSMMPSFSSEGGRYLAFLTPGIMGFQAVTAGLVGGSMLWADRRFGMLAQLLVGPFSRLQYLFGIILTSMVFGLVGTAVMLLGSYLLIGSLSITIYSSLIMFCIVSVGSILFGSLMLLISAFVRSNNTYTGIQVLIVFVVNFASTVFYPLTSNLPVGMRLLFMINPLTYVVNLTRDVFLGEVPGSDIYLFPLLIIETIVMIGLATQAYIRSEVSFE
jgi:ABC-2 type transport system permease protein